MNILKKPLREMAEFSTIKNDLKSSEGIVELNGCGDSQKLNMIYGFGDGYKNKVIVTYSEQKAREIRENYLFYDEGINVYPARDLIFYQADVHGNQLSTERLGALKALFDQRELTLVTSFDALMEHLIPYELLMEHVIFLELGDSLDLGELSGALTSMGYVRNYQVEDKGQFSVHGGIIDIYPVTSENPVRVELWGDDIDSIRSFDILTQRSLEKLDSFTVYPSSEIVLEEEDREKGIRAIKKAGKKQEKIFREKFLSKEAFAVKSLTDEIVEKLENLLLEGSNIESFLSYFFDETVSLLSYFDKEDTLIILDEPARLKEMGDLIEKEFTDSMEGRLERGLILPLQAKLLYKRKEIFSKLSEYHCLSLNALPLPKSVCKTISHYSVVAKSVNSYNNSFDMLVSDLKRLKKNKYRVLLLSASRTRARRLCDDLMDNEVVAYYSENMDKDIAEGEIQVSYGRLKQGFEYPMLKFIVISENDIFTTQKKKKRKKSSSGASIKSFTELSVGDYVIHESHGLGVYEGIEQVTLDNITRDYMKIRYKDDGRLFVPATSLDLIQKYSKGEGGASPKLNKLGSLEWTKTKQRVKREIDEIASDLVELYAKRMAKSGYIFTEDTVWQTEFEERFQFEETEDQLKAIEDTKRDMESKKIMDRLICGDVGYGKTEIAIRAAFKAVQDGKQVVYLVPTTILAQQHYNTFVQRMRDYPVRIDMLSRFCTPLEVKKTIGDLKKGFVDIVIGTHRVLSKDVEFKDLGLLIIDEEQRFGVRHKDMIKKYKETVDVLTLTATPIPRTLHMSLIGIRDMSLLEEAPLDRMPIQTFVMEYNEELVKEAIGRELSRGGQVFYVYNRVNTIADMAASLQRLMPDAVIRYAHGQMKEHELENIMMDFVNGDIDVLVSTTIVETGLDIPNVNTMIIHDSDNMGLSQLYQLRGRVGRSNRTAYAFMLYKKDKLLKEVAEKRLKAIREFTELGSGYKIALRDLEIRGAGNLLGERQSGHMETIGYDLYCKMLNDAVREKKGEELVEDFETLVDINVDAYIPDSYIMNEYQKIDIYKRIASVSNEEEREEMKDELVDRFGELPESVLNLLEVAFLRALAREVYITEIKGENRSVKLTVFEKADYDTLKLPGFISSYKGRLVLKTAEKPYFIYFYEKGVNYENAGLIRYIKELLMEIKEGLLKEKAPKEA
ncbi:MAG: transcription-repair coupling factor [Lachnospiraceae bacterium]|nr:transcription-repair coupling factor [Lachnospiraceae bacterium]